MELLEKYAPQELQEMKEYCQYMMQCFNKNSFRLASDIHEIALEQLNKELDNRVLKIEGRKG